MSTIVCPGQRLASVRELQASSGTYHRDGQVYASIVGTKEVDEDASKDELPTVRVVRKKDASSVPEIGSMITGKVIRINPRFATLSIMIVGSVPCRENFQGIIRVQDVRATEKDKIQIYRSFRPGDIVRAQVISLGDARSYYLSTALNECGVIFAQSVAGHTMVPISWEEMICPYTKVVEHRKCAKPTAT
ncbi:uncharacterized protein BJ171DRAFT_522997 [Polychytrium aggregatum]|uniref:uncharacterized protein n=1 Tax=Polychytrium aggregatum TaxID=110093 RepID=UPI0022FEC709|nr:uncharacterized protein BJ171DRAFT_522997 [Polychytrium aggregatum]KAI9197053.1 hypothetical protein BJ171DRAFT_522997 [Polychytrium aggregatum]